MSGLTTEQIDMAMGRIFFEGRDPRSQEYRAGCRAALERSAVGNPYGVGNAQSDAWFSGWDEGYEKRKERLQHDHE